MPEGDESDHDENGLTLKEERELKWRDENEADELAGMDKNAMREFYKVRRPALALSRTLGFVHSLMPR